MSTTVKIFDIVNGKIVPSEHCYILQSLKAVMDSYPKEQYLKIYGYAFYMTCPDKELNPFYHTPTDDKQDIIIKEVGIDFSLDDVVITNCVEFCKERYETETVRAHRGMKNAVDRLAVYLESVEYSTGRDGSMSQIIQAMKNFSDIRESFKQVTQDLEEEQQVLGRGKRQLGYDQ